MLDEKFWRKYFKVYDVLNFCIPYQEMLEQIVRELRIKPGELILDAGAGTGNLALSMKKRGAQIVALDSIEEVLGISTEKVEGIKTICHDLRKKLPFPDNYFDKIVSVNTLFLIEPFVREDTVKEFYRILKKGEKIVLVNLKDGFRPLKIYFYHFNKTREREGLFTAIKQIVKFITPLLKILYYAKKIEKDTNQEQKFFKKGEQISLLEKAGFKCISDTMEIYANQAFLNSAYKL